MLCLVAGLAAGAEAAEVRVVESGPGYTRLLFEAPAPTALFGDTVDPQDLPPAALRSYVHSALVGVPLDGEVDLAILEMHEAGRVRGVLPNDLRWDGPAWADEPAFLRHQRVLPVAFGPQAAAGGATLYDRILVEVRFAPAVGDVPHRPDPFETAYRGAVINYGQARVWRAPRWRAGRAAQVDGVLPEAGMLRVSVRTEGLYRVTGADLEAAGIDAGSVDPAAIRVLHGGGLTLGLAARPSNGLLPQEVPAVVDDGGDGRFDEDDVILFHGQGTERWEWSARLGTFWRTNRYTRDNVYWIDTAAPAPGLRAATRSGAPESIPDGVVEQYRERLREEDERIILRQIQGINSGYDWYWDVFTGNARNFTFVANAPVADVPANVRVAFWGTSNTSHLFDLRWNDAAIGRRQFSGTELDTIAAEAATGAVEGLNQVGLFHRDNSPTRLDWYEIDYVRRLAARNGEVLFDWTAEADGGVPVDAETGGLARFRLTGFSADNGMPRIFELSDGLSEIVDADYDERSGSLTFDDRWDGQGQPPRYLVTQPIRWRRPDAIVRDSHERLRDPSLRADYVIISHEDFLPAARRLADWRATDDRFGDPFQAKVVDVQDIYDEFSGGLLDPMAIRAFVNYAVDNWAVPPVYITLFGDGTYDHKNNSGVSHTNWIPPYQDGESTYDEWYVRIEGLDRLPDAAISRLSVQTAQEAEDLVDKILAYDREPESGPWQAQVLLVADDITNPQIPDHFESYFVNDAEFLWKNDLPEELDLTKLYIGAYDLEGRTKPRARDDFIQLFNEGALLLTYLGHGNPEVLAHEQIFLLSRDLERIDNGRRLPFVYTAASQVGVFDDPTKESMPETMVKKVDGGAIGFVAATRVGYHNSNMTLARRFHRQMYQSGREHVPMSLALMEAKQMVAVSGSDRTNIQRYSLFGDAGQRLNRPRLRVELELPDSLEALMEVDVTGRIVDDEGQARSDYSGQAVVRAFDSSAQSQVEGLPYEQMGAPIFRGRVDVEQGTFRTRFRVPKDITYRSDRGRISAYVDGGGEPAFGSRTELVLQGTATDAGSDATGPQIRIAFANSPGFRSGDFVSARPTLAAVLVDPSGINITGETGHEIELRVDDGPVTSVTQHYTSLADHTQGVVEVPLGDLAPGEHTLRLKAWDSFNNSARAEATFVVAETAESALAQPLFHPNPTTDGRGHFTYTLAAPATQVEIGVFALSGRRVDRLDGSANLGYNQVEWTPSAELANGTYVYRLTAHLESGTSTTREGWIQVLR